MAKIVVAEDAPHILKLLEMTLRKRGHQAISCLSGDSALESIRLHLPDLAILDVMMPGLDGLSVLSALKDDPQTSRIPIIILTSHGQSLTRQQATLSGADCFMTKPFSPTTLLDTIDRLTTPAP